MTTALDMQRARAAAIARELVSRSPDGSVVCVFAGGSLSRGEVWAAEFDGLAEIYSDVDLYVLARRRDVATVRQVAGDVARAAPAVTGARFMRSPDIGVYPAEELGTLPLRPGTVDLAAVHLLLYGDAAEIRVLRAASPRDIPADEALYLLENRLVELRASGHERSDAEKRLESVLALKARLDVHSAHAIVARTFRPSLDERRTAFATSPPVTIDELERKSLAAAYGSALRLDEWLREADPDAEARSARRALSSAWRALAPLVMQLPPGTPAARLIEQRCRAGRLWSNFRSVIRLRHYAGMPFGVAAACAMSLARLSPRTALRVDALVRQLYDEGAFDATDYERHQRYTDRLAARFGFDTGTSETRARAMHELISQG